MVLDLHFEDDDCVCVTGNCLLAPLKELPFNTVKLAYIGASQALSCLKFLERKNSTQEARDIMIDILIHLVLCWPGLKKLYEDKVPEFIVVKIKATLPKKIKRPKSSQNQR